ncbi:LysM peptidoglycan-binding domain-containing protein [Jannaschia pohangensis]|uniref:Amino acid ABC transporter substrate-binding protein, PAAT family n=1 Tax=Jannaschia pohangensis TaxID=390807 RepID=A0A1I3ISQ4_9RHOB|nr:LysM peptidoglycan-binding domain-containing protein [Jannaschia pohangensis]SFI50975.1 amino acid ABC transporter substrate-binding protein, PAAT family [Jannaschia pohangensis]
MQKQFGLNARGCLVLAQLLGGVALSASVLATTPAAAQEECTSYTVVRGDTLSLIAKRGNVAGGFQAIFSANSNTLDNPNIVQVGQVLQIPCRDGSLPNAAAAQESAAAAAPTPVPVTSTPSRPLRIATGSGYAPFTDEDMADGGALTKMVRRAVAEGNPDQEFSISFVNDWGAHLDSLVPSGAIDMTFPWFKPDCSKVEFLSEASAYRCTGFNHSEPLYDALVGYYTLNGSAYADATTYQDIMGARICRPEAWFTFDLEAEQLMPPNVELVRPVPQDGCWQLLLDGEVDIVTLDALPAEEDYRELGLEDQVANIEALASKQTMHVFVAKDNVFANEALQIVNAGLEDLRLSGEWFEIVRSGILETVDN